MKDRERIQPPTNIGISLLMVVFLIMCLFTFSAIALVQANNELTLATRNSESRTNYYRALSKAESDLSKTNSDLAAGTISPKKTIRRSYDINDTQALKVVLSLRRSKGRRYYVITTALTEATSAWEGDDKLNVVQ